MANVRMFKRKVAWASATPPPGVLGSLVELSALGFCAVSMCRTLESVVVVRFVPWRGFCFETHKPFVHLWRRGESLVPQNYRYQLVYKYLSAETLLRTWCLLFAVF